MIFLRNLRENFWICISLICKKRRLLRIFKLKILNWLRKLLQFKLFQVSRKLLYLLRYNFWIQVIWRKVNYLMNLYCKNVLMRKLKNRFKKLEIWLVNFLSKNILKFINFWIKFNYFLDQFDKIFLVHNLSVNLVILLFLLMIHLWLIFVNIYNVWSYLLNIIQDSKY